MFDQCLIHWFCRRKIIAMTDREVQLPRRYQRRSTMSYHGQRNSLTVCSTCASTAARNLVNTIRATWSPKLQTQMTVTTRYSKYASIVGVRSAVAMSWRGRHQLIICCSRSGNAIFSHRSTEERHHDFEGKHHVSCALNAFSRKDAERCSSMTWSRTVARWMGTRPRSRLPSETTL